MKNEKYLYFLFLHGISIILFLNTIRTLKDPIISTNISNFLIYFIVSSIFLGASLVPIRELDKKEKAYVVIISTLTVIIINVFYYTSFWAMVYYISGILLFILKEKLFGLTPILFSLLFFTTYFANQNVSTYYVERYLINFTLYYIDPIIDRYINNSYEDVKSMVNLQKELFLSGYDTAAMLAYNYTKNPELFTYLNGYKEYIINQIDKEYENYLIKNTKDLKTNIQEQIKNILLSNLLYAFLMFLLGVYTILSIHTTIAVSMKNLLLFVLNHLKRE